ncbi:MAG: hypothetical protein ACI85I_002278 [Arenicella sp.]|jgi:hypothetical protein
MILKIKNLGPIKEASIDLSKKHYLFVGYNNTGKTYLTNLLYDVFKKETLMRFSEEHDSSTLEFPFVLNEEFVRKTFASYAEYIKNETIPTSFNTDKNSKFILDKLEISFDFDFENDVKLPALNTSINFQFNINGNSEKEFNAYHVQKDANSLSINYLEEDINRVSFLLDSMEEEIERDSFLLQIEEAKRMSIIMPLLNMLLNIENEPFFLPANRISLLENANDLVEEMNRKNKILYEDLKPFMQVDKPDKEQINKAIKKRHESNNHTKHVEELVNRISELKRQKSTTSIADGRRFYDKLLIRLEKTMGGTVSFGELDKSNNREQIVKLHANEVLKMHLASSAINQLGMVSLYLKYWAEESHNFLLIDEPGENLHPKNQIEILNILLNFASENENRILITTHSPLMAEMFNNYLILGQLENDNQDIADSLGMENIKLTPKNAGIYFFNGTKVVEVFSSEYGAIFSSFKDAHERVHATNQYLGELMFKQENTTVDV